MTMKNIEVIEKIIARDLDKKPLSIEELRLLMEVEDQGLLSKIYAKAYAVKAEYVGKISYYRGLIEFSNLCGKNCLYCGIRKDNLKVERFSMDQQEILALAKWAYDNEYGSLTIQSGERQDEKFVGFVEDTLLKIQELTKNELGITLCCGEQSEATYKRWYKAGALRYLLRIETTNPELYHKIHPCNSNHSYHTRVNCLAMLKTIGYQVGTGVMIGLPGQTREDLIQDIEHFRQWDIDMIGMGPYVVHKDTPLGQEALAMGLDSDEGKAYRFNLGLKMVALTRLYLKDVNIAATTALQALDSLGREKALAAGANILMPIITLPKHRKKYQLYDNKPCLDDDASHCKGCLTHRVMSVGDKVGWKQQGNSPHFYNKKRS